LKTKPYNKEHYKWWNNPAVNSAKQIVPYILDCLPIKSVLDFGCAQGGWLSVFHELGIKNIKGLDGVWVNTEDLLVPLESFHCINLEKYQHPPTEKYDLCICLEVAEHLDNKYSDALIANLTAASDIILFSAAVPEQGGQNHVNERPPSFWQKKFENQGFEQFDFLRDKYWQNDGVEWWYKQNIMFYSKANLRPKLKKISNDFLGKHVIHPKAFSEKCSELSIENTSMRNLLKEILKRVFKVN
jgi:hypothetical protein